MRYFLILTIAAGFILATPAISNAGTIDWMEGYSVGAGYNQATENAADEMWVISLKNRTDRWSYGIDGCYSEGHNGWGDNYFGFAWAAWMEEFDRPDWQDYGVYVGAGAGIFFLDQNFVDWPAGPFVIIGWDLSDQASVEGKVGYFGENYWGTGIFYWNF